MIAEIRRAGVTSNAGIRHGHIGGNTHAAQMRDFVGGTLLDRNLFARGNREVEGRNRRGHVKRYAMLVRQHGNLIGPDFVCRVAVGRDAVRADDDRGDAAAFS